MEHSQTRAKVVVRSGERFYPCTNCDYCWETEDSGRIQLHILDREVIACSSCLAMLFDLCPECTVKHNQFLEGDLPAVYHPKLIE